MVIVWISLLSLKGEGTFADTLILDAERVAAVSSFQFAFLVVPAF